MPHLTDINGAVLRVGDRVESTVMFERGFVHAGTIVEILVGQGVITVRHYRGCCESGRESSSAPQCWRRKSKRKPREPKRPTAWDKILQDD